MIKFIFPVRVQLILCNCCAEANWIS